MTLRLGRSVTELLQNEARAMQRSGYRPPPQIVYTPPSKDVLSPALCELCGRLLPPHLIFLHFGLGVTRCARCLPTLTEPIPVEDD